VENIDEKRVDPSALGGTETGRHVFLSSDSPFESKEECGKDILPALLFLAEGVLNNFIGTFD
jgi:hypothetical protein